MKPAPSLGGTVRKPQPSGGCHGGQRVSRQGSDGFLGRGLALEGDANMWQSVWERRDLGQGGACRRVRPAWKAPEKW
jgi:hypothetical protein